MLKQCGVTHIKVKADDLVGYYPIFIFVYLHNPKLKGNDMKRIFIFILCVTAIGSAQKKPFAVEDLYKIKSISTPQYSPDG